jgi:hypothetical protein
MEKIINKNLKKKMAVQGSLRCGFELFHKDLIRALANSVSDEKLIQEARNLGKAAS